MWATTRGGSPSPYDRNLATIFGWKAVNLIVHDQFGQMAALQEGRVTGVPLEAAIEKLKLVTEDTDLFRAASSTGVCFGRAD